MRLGTASHSFCRRQVVACRSVAEQAAEGTLPGLAEFSPDRFDPSPCGESFIAFVFPRAFKVAAGNTAIGGAGTSKASQVKVDT